MKSKEQTIQNIVQLMKDYKIDIQDIASSMIESKPDKIRHISLLLIELSYLGGLLTFAGICMYIAEDRAPFLSSLRIFITLGVGMIMYIYAYILGSQSQYSKIATPLFIISSYLQAGGLLVFMSEIIPGAQESHDEVPNFPRGLHTRLKD